MHRDGWHGFARRLDAALGDQSERRLIHRLESVKLLPPAASIRTNRRVTAC